MPGSEAIRQATERGWLHIVEVRDKRFVKALQRDLDKGEAEAIVLALQVGAEWTLLDEREARKAAKSLGLKVTGVLGILIRAQREGKLASLQKAIEHLQKRAGFHIQAELLLEILKESKEGPE